jgi:hypothetical protein
MHELRASRLFCLRISYQKVYQWKREECANKHCASLLLTWHINDELGSTFKQNKHMFFACMRKSRKGVYCIQTDLGDFKGEM